MKKLVLVRHCQSDGQHTDSPLTNNGVNQARRLSEFFKKHDLTIDRIISSPSMRAVETIKPYALLNEQSIETDARLNERILSDQPVDDWLDVVEASFEDLDYRLPGGESSNEALGRGLAVINEAINDPSHETIAIVTHGNLLMLLLNHFEADYGFKQWRLLKNPDVFIIEHEDEQIQLEHIW
ncbi:2,3-bisphosphoglycerate-dependent phosphoglycerate mutase [Pelagirhabdus alkalitolerans]|uniref:2,3-bisphosphoglycerate-dependent phosphoglycerate mutase n=1 Tax=Pelagirhabdus alkalitolerans TaxID=1612202 RepID=A0A1G6H925_9BACI|nr:histidine phosphatase family protein [Pelagirhabdus alkalitolerans]SDB90760.1 2,3-bisphosphoglycerate-dependent phosphoglycerate mutase [Pelagirhabdus alkalitolerans]